MSEGPEISNHESTVVRSLAGDADALGRAGREFLISDQPSRGNSRAAVATRGNIRDSVDFQDSSTIRLNVGKVCGVLF